MVLAAVHTRRDKLARAICDGRKRTWRRFRTSGNFGNRIFIQLNFQQHNNFQLIYHLDLAEMIFIEVDVGACLYVRR